MQCSIYLYRFLFIIFFGIGLLSACAETQRLRAAPSLKTANPMHDIAIVGAANVFWPRTDFKSWPHGSETKEPVLGLAESKHAVESGVAGVKAALEKKGYRVVYAQPVGVGYKWPTYTLNWVFNFGEIAENDSRGRKYRILDGAPAYEYSANEKIPEYRAAVRHEFERLNALNSHKQVRALVNYSNCFPNRVCPGEKTAGW